MTVFRHFPPSTNLIRVTDFFQLDPTCPRDQNEGLAGRISRPAHSKINKGCGWPGAAIRNGGILR
jgi:hypothetical protein